MPSNIANPCDAPTEDPVGGYEGLFRLAFGAYGDTVVYAWADSVEDAFEEAVEWLDDNAPGHLVQLTEDDLKEAAEDLGVEWAEHWPDWEDEDFQKVVDAAEADLTLIGHTTLKHGSYVVSHEWFVDDVTDEEEYNRVLDESIEECGD